MFAYFALTIAGRIGRDIRIDIFEYRDFTHFGPKGCNFCGGIVSESLVQVLAAEGINIPSGIVRRGIQSYVMHLDNGSTVLETPRYENRIAAMFRGAGPLGFKEPTGQSFDGYLLDRAISVGARIVNKKVRELGKDDDGKYIVVTDSEKSEPYDLLVGAAGVNTAMMELFSAAGFGYTPPKATKTAICEFHLGEGLCQQHFGNSMHVFLLNIPRLKFAAMIPKGGYVTLAMLGKRVDKEIIQSFIDHPKVKSLFPDGWDSGTGIHCRCYPGMNVGTARQPFGDRVVMIGDAVTSKLFKDGIGSAYLTSKAAAKAAILAGVSEKHFRKHYWKACKRIRTDNIFGQFVFLFTGLIQRLNPLKSAILGMVRNEGKQSVHKRFMSNVLWDTFTGSSTYRHILQRTIKPIFLMNLIREFFKAVFIPGKYTSFNINSIAGKDSIGMVYGRRYNYQAG